MKLIENLYQYRELLKSNIKKEIRGKYKGSVLGVLWSFLNPLLMVMVYFLVFPFLFRNTVDNYLIYLVIGVIPWNFFTTTMNQGIFLSIPKSDIKFFKELAKKMGWDIDIREDFLKDYIASRPKRVNLSEEEILAELNAIRYEK